VIEEPGMGVGKGATARGVMRQKKKNLAIGPKNLWRMFAEVLGLVVRFRRKQGGGRKELLERTRAMGGGDVTLFQLGMSRGGTDLFLKESLGSVV